MAQAIYEQVTGKTDVVSAGTHVHEHENERLVDFEPARETLLVLNELGIDASSKVRNQLTADMVAHADQIVSIVPEETLPAYAAQSGKVTYWCVIDPFQMTIDDTRQVRDTIRALVLAFVER
jgi:protein-tyrosine-phosphatase